MKTLKRFILAASVSMVLWQQATPCADYDDPGMYNHFNCVDDLPNYASKNISESAKFWARYVGKPNSEEIIEAATYLSHWSLEDEDTSNALLLELRAQGKTEALEYLKLNYDLLGLQEGGYGWDYQRATPADYEAILARIDALKVTGELARRKTFMKMRCLFSLKDYDACLRLWDNFASKWEPSPLRDRVKGYVAGVYYQRKQYDKAIPLFFELGDDVSIQVCVNHMLAATDIEQEYQRDANSPLLGYILQDYGNYFFHAKSNEYWTQGEENPIWTTVTNERNKVITLAERIVRENKTKEPQMWQAFVGFLQYMNGDYELAYQSFEKAEGMRGTSRIKEDVPHFKFLAALKKRNKPANFEHYMAQELETLATSDVFQVQRDLYIPEVINYVNNKYHDYRLTFVMESALKSYGVEDKMDRELTVDEVLGIQAYLNQKPGNELEAFAKRHTTLTGVSRDRIEEYLGTKYLRLGLYANAISHLEKVADSTLTYIGVTRYLCSRQMPDGFDRVVYSDPEWDVEYPVQNKKLHFCQRALELQNTINSNIDETKAQAALQLAKMLFQASPSGDMWGISEYWWSSAGEMNNELSEQAVVYLQEAIKCTKDYNTLVECHYGLAAINLTQNNVLAYDSDRQDYVISAQGSQYEGYSWLRKQTKRTHPLYESCDWLKLYLAD